MSELTADASHGSGDNKHKKHRKRTFGEANGESAGIANAELSKEEKREAKRLKNLEKANGSREDKDTQQKSTAIPDTPLPDVSNDAPTSRKPSKEERREAKRLEKSKEADGVVRDPNEAAIVEGAKKDVTDQTSAKALRKAEKATLKASKKGAEDKSQTHLVKADAPNGHAMDSKGQKPKKQQQSKPLQNYEEDSSLAALPHSEIETFLSANYITVDDPTSASPLRPITQFSYLPPNTISDPSIFSTFKSPTPIQSAAWPFLLSNRDVIGVAETGSGKTLAFGVPCIRSITSTSPKSSSAAKAVIVSPTRELAVQIHAQIETLATPASLTTACIYGGVPKDPQRAALSTASIIVATPGRLNDLINEGSANLCSVHYLVLDEADRMLDKGFEEEIRKILSQTPSTGRQTLMFTATWPPSVRTLASTFMTHPVHISIGANNPSGELRANTSITQHIEVLEPYAKQSRLLQILSKYHHSKQNKQKQKDRILIFALYKKEAARLETFLLRNSLPAAAIHGDMTQSARQTSLDNFKSGTTPLLVATDVAARGLDIPAVKLVINVTFPLTVEDYVHRIGRTGRAGAEGEAITLFTEHDKGNAGGLINVLKAAGQDVPEELMRFGTTVKRKGHEAYGAFYKDIGEGKKEGTKIRFD